MYNTGLRERIADVHESKLSMVVCCVQSTLDYRNVDVKKGS